MISSALRRLRKGRGLSQNKLAAALHISQQAVSKWENGTAEPDMSCLNAIADFYGVPTDCILGRETALQARMRELLARLTPEQVAQLCEIALEMANGAEEKRTGEINSD